MARWKQVWNKDLGKSEFIPVDDAARAQATSAYIHGDIQPFVSPVDGSVISDRRQLAEHNKRNNVVNTHEFGTEHWDIKRKERERFYNGEHTPKESLRRKQEIYEAITRAEREHS